MAIKMAETIMQRYPNPWDYPYKAWCYCHGHMLEGFMKVIDHVGDNDSRYFNYILSYAEHHVDNDGNLLRFSGTSMDDMMAGTVICWAYHATGEEKYKKAADIIRASFDDYPRTSDGAFWHHHNTPGQFWIDGVFMGEMFLTRYGQYVGDREYCYYEAARQLKLAYKHLSKGNTNFLLHAWWDSTQGEKPVWADPVTGLSSEVWAEGLGWYANILVEVLAVLPETHEDYNFLREQLDSLASGLETCQDESGGWWDIVDRQGEADNWLDVSGTSYFLYAIQKGIDIGLLDADRYAPVADRAYSCLTNDLTEINNLGFVDISETCDGLSVQSSLERYYHCGSKFKINAKEAVAAYLWATAIMEKDEQQVEIQVL